MTYRSIFHADALGALLHLHPAFLDVGCLAARRGLNGPLALGPQCRHQAKGGGAYGTHAVATRNPNELMLFDMSGNVHEWCEDWYGSYSSADQVDPTGPSTGTNRVYRGGSWYFDEWFCRVSFRNGTVPTYRNYGIGLRLAL